MAGSPAASCIDLLQICQLCVLWKSGGPNFFFSPTSFLYFWVLKQTSRRDNTVAIVNKNENFLCGPLVRTGERRSKEPESHHPFLYSGNFGR